MHGTSISGFPSNKQKKMFEDRKIILPSHVALVYSVHLWYLTSMLMSIGTCQNKVLAD